MFVVNLAIADFAMMLKTPIFIYNSFNHGFALGQFYCQIFAAVGSMSGILQSTTNLCIAYDRYRYMKKILSVDGDLKYKRAICILLIGQK
jgi:r-opsin